MSWRWWTEGGPVFLLEVPRARSWTPTQAFHEWSEVGHPRAISWSGSVLIVQLGRYIDGRKDVSQVAIDSPVMVPVFDEEGRIQRSTKLQQRLFTLEPGRHRATIELCCETETGGDTQTTTQEPRWLISVLSTGRMPTCFFWCVLLKSRVTDRHSWAP